MKLEKLKQAFWSVVTLGVFGLFFYYVYSNRVIAPKPKPEKVCALIIYYNPKIKYFDTTYSTATLLTQFRLIDFTSPDNKKWVRKDFINCKDVDEDDGLAYFDVTVKDGSRYRIAGISKGNCDIKSKEDSIRKNSKSLNDDD